MVREQKPTMARRKTARPATRGKKPKARKVSTPLAGSGPDESILIVMEDRRVYFPAGDLALRIRLADQLHRVMHQRQQA